MKYNLYCSKLIEDKIKSGYNTIYKKDNISFIEIENAIVHSYCFDNNIHYGGISDADFNIIDTGSLYWGGEFFVEQYIEKK